MKPRLSVIVPVYNEEENLENAISQLDSILKKECADYEIIIVDSASTDKTGDIAQRLVKRYKKVKNIRQPVRKGFGNGLREGYQNAKLEYVWYVDADLPYDLMNLKKSFSYMGEYDAIIGYKTGKRENYWRSIMSSVYNALIRVVFNLPYRDINYSYKIIRNSTLKRLDLRADGWFVTVELLVELNRGKYKVKEVHVPFKLRTKGESKVNNYPKVIWYFIKEIFFYKKRLFLRR